VKKPNGGPFWGNWKKNVNGVTKVGGERLSGGPVLGKHCHRPHSRVCDWGLSGGSHRGMKREKGRERKLYLAREPQTPLQKKKKRIEN